MAYHKSNRNYSWPELKELTSTSHNPGRTVLRKLINRPSGTRQEWNIKEYTNHLTNSEQIWNPFLYKSVWAQFCSGLFILLYDFISTTSTKTLTKSLKPCSDGSGDWNKIWPLQHTKKASTSSHNGMLFQQGHFMCMPSPLHKERHSVHSVWKEACNVPGRLSANIMERSRNCRVGERCN